MITMKNFFRTHSEAVLIFFTIFFLVTIGTFLYGTINVVFSEIDRAIISAPAQSGEGFDLSDAAKIDFRGLLNGSSSAIDAVQMPPVKVVAPATSVAPPASVSTTSASTTAPAATSTAVIPVVPAISSVTASSGTAAL